MPNWSALQNIQLLHDSLADWLLAGLAFLLIFMLLPLARRSLESQRRRHAGREPPSVVGLLAHLAAHTSRIVLWITALYAAERIVTWPARIDRLFDIAIVVGFWLQLGLWAMATVRYALQRRRTKDEDAQLAGSINILLFVARLLVWGIAVLLALSNLGINITALVAGLGIGGIAIALVGAGHPRRPVRFADHRARQALRHRRHAAIDESRGAWSTSACAARACAASPGSR